MGTSDLFTDDFPHGSYAGFEQGCRSSAVCPNYQSTEWLTCREARIARSGDFNLSRQPADTPIPRGVPTPAPRHTNHRLSEAPTSPDRAPGERNPKDQVSGVNAPDIVAKDDHDAAENAPVVPAPDTSTSTSTVNEAVNTSKDDHHAEPISQPVAPAVDVDPRLIIRTGRRGPILHGTISGYTAGCRDSDQCPATSITGTSCRTAQRDYQRGWRANHDGSTPPTELPAPEVTATSSDDDDYPIAHIGDAGVEKLRDELALAERAAAELKTEHRRQVQDLEQQLREAGGQINSAAERLTAALESIHEVSLVSEARAETIHNLEQLRSGDQAHIKRLERDIAEWETLKPRANTPDTPPALAAALKDIDIDITRDGEALQIHIALPH